MWRRRGISHLRLAGISDSLGVCGVQIFGCHHDEMIIPDPEEPATSSHASVFHPL